MVLVGEKFIHSMSDKATYMGFDLSTQQMKVLVINDELKILHQASVMFDIDLPEFRTRGGANRIENSDVVTAKPLMWVKALDMALDRLKATGFDFGTVRSISGSGQQHGSVFWRHGTRKKLQTLNPENPLHLELSESFALQDSPIWMDSSTTEYCKKLEETVGGPEKLAQITGSRAYERFTGPQIAKIAHTKSDIYQTTERISLVSSFVASILLGGYAPIDLSDGSGMNLLNIWNREWSKECLNSCGPDLQSKLGQNPIPSTDVLGEISPYYVQRYGFNRTCKIVAFTGDNPASLVGMCLGENDIGVSLGTSDTVFLWLKSPKPGVHGNIFCNPLCSTDWMSLLCFKNGSLTRERIRDECANGHWDHFNKLVESTPPGNSGNIGFFFDCMEIYPPLKGDFRFNAQNESVSSFSEAVEARACIEGQFLRLRLHSELLGYETTSNGNEASIKVTGGASCNPVFLQILSDIFNRPVYRQPNANSACLGGALMAKYAVCKDKISFKEMTYSLISDEKICDPSENSDLIYTPMVERYRILENRISRDTHHCEADDKNSML
ncbi:xylulose kinase-like [Brevipalpus obovatus]|uniref:xylulose kinase-like n=1 Tax=Brevipalpus obovatus TaxID=246614 RepID=UPI003D9F2C57